MNQELFEALNQQIKHEFFSSFLYLSIASYFENIPLEGVAKWFRNQAKEEHEHAMKIYDYILDRNLHVDLQAIEKPMVHFSSIEQAFLLALEHERKVTKWIHNIYDLATQKQDHATAVFLHWFITEQVEEEKNANDNYDQIKFIGEDKSALFVIDQNFAAKAEG